MKFISIFGLKVIKNEEISRKNTKKTLEIKGFLYEIKIVYTSAVADSNTIWPL